MQSSSRFQLAQELLEQRRIEESLAAFHQAEREGYDPDLCAAGRWTCLMLAGCFEQAWQESDAISLRGKPDKNRFWDGRNPSANRVLIRCLHGLGDTLQFARYASLLRARDCRVIIETQPALKDLLMLSKLADEVITWNEQEPPYDQQVEVIELPRIFRTTLDSIPSRVPYLIAPKADAPQSRNGDFRVALVWCSSGYDPTRSISLRCMAQLCSVTDVSFYSLQADPSRQDLRGCQAAIHDAYDSSLVTTAKTLQSMDLLITVDTMVAHMAGALGKPVWTLLPYCADWRWMLHREDSPWYPTMRLFRQSSAGDWQGVIERVRRALEQRRQAVAEVAGEGAVRGSAAPGSVK